MKILDSKIVIHYLIFLGAFFTILLGSGLMSLAFFSSRHGFDEQVDHDLEDLFKKFKDR